MKLFIDTNVFLQFFVKDDQEMARAVRKILSMAETGKLSLATSPIVLMEIIYTLGSFYKLDRKRVVEHIEAILAIKNLLLVETTDFSQAFRLFKKHQEKVADCLVTTQVPNNYLLCSFDQDLEKLIEKERFFHPSRILEYKQ